MNKEEFQDWQATKNPSTIIFYGIAKGNSWAAGAREAIYCPDEYEGISYTWGLGTTTTNNKVEIILLWKGLDLTKSQDT